MLRVCERPTTFALTRLVLRLPQLECGSLFSVRLSTKRPMNDDSEKEIKSIHSFARVWMIAERLPLVCPCLGRWLPSKAFPNPNSQNAGV